MGEGARTEEKGFPILELSCGGALTEEFGFSEFLRFLEFFRRMLNYPQGQRALGSLVPSSLARHTVNLPRGKKLKIPREGALASWGTGGVSWPGRFWNFPSKKVSKAGQSWNPPRLIRAKAGLVPGICEGALTPGGCGVPSPNSHTFRASTSEVCGRPHPGLGRPDFLGYTFAYIFIPRGFDLDLTHD